MNPGLPMQSAAPGSSFPNNRMRTAGSITRREGSGAEGLERSDSPDLSAIAPRAKAEGQAARESRAAIRLGVPPFGSVSPKEYSPHHP